MDRVDLHHIKVKGDGDCFFNSILGYLKIDKEYGHLDQKTPGVRQLRTDCVRWLKRNLDFKTPSGLTLREEIEDFVNDNDKGVKSVSEYLKYMDKSSRYAGQIEIYAIAHILNRNIRTFIEKDGRYSNVGLGYEIKKKDLMDDIHLHHNLGNIGNIVGVHHFEILYPGEKAKYVSGEKIKSLKKRTSKLSQIQ